MLKRVLNRLYLSIRNRSAEWRALAFAASVMIVFSTTYVMILPAITLSSDSAEEAADIYLEEAAAAEEEYESDDGNEEYEEAVPVEEADPEAEYEEEGDPEDQGEAEAETDDPNGAVEQSEIIVSDDAQDIQSESISVSDATELSGSSSPSVTEEFLTSEEMAEDGRYIIVRYADDGNAYAMNTDGYAVPVVYDPDLNTAYCEDENQNIVWIKEGYTLRSEKNTYIKLDEETENTPAVSDTEAKLSVEKPDEGQFAGALYRIVVTDGVPEYYALVLSPDGTYFTTTIIDTKPVKRTILAKEPVNEEKTEELTADPETTESSAESVTEENLTVSAVESVAEPVLTTYEAGSVTVPVEGADYTIQISWGAEACIPEDAVFKAISLEQQEDYTEYADKAVEAAAAEQPETVKEESSSAIGVFDLTIYNAAGQVIQPAAPVNVSVDFGEALGEETEVCAVHFPGTGVQEEPVDDGIEYDEIEKASDTADAAVIEAVNEGGAVSFEAESFSVYVIVGTTIEKSFLSDSGVLYEVKVTYGPGAHIPEGAHLKITEFDEDSEEYDYARRAVLADKLAKGEAVDLSVFGLAALDISILDANGNEIEPDAAVQVDIKIKGLPGVEDLNEVANTLAIQHHVEVEDGVVVENVFDGNAEASFKLETNETVAEEGSAVDPNSVNEEDFVAPGLMEIDSVDIEFETEAFSNFTISWNYAYGNGVKVNYVDENGNPLTVKNSTFLTNLNGSSASPAYLIYDIDGYEYDHTDIRYYYNGRWYTEHISPQLRRHNASYYEDWNGWIYQDGSGWQVLSSSNASNKDEISVVYRKKADIAQGGTPTVKQSGSVAPPVDPRINKESTPNGDDTNTLALSLISDTAKLEVEKLADVIVVFDVSGSMVQNNLGDTTRLDAAKTAVNNLATQLAAKKNSAGKPLVRMSLIQFSTNASSVIGMTELTDRGLATFKNNVNALTADGGTNWDHALQLANEENDLDSGRATFVIFVTDGDPTFRNARMDVTDLALKSETNNASSNPNPFYLSNNVYGPGDNDKTGQCYAAAVEQGKAIIEAGKNIYTIGISSDVKKVEAFNTDIQGNGAYLAANTSALNQAFLDIETSISGAAGWGNIQMTDGITNLTNTVQKTGLINVGGDFSYWIAPAPENWASMTDAEKKAYTPAATAFKKWDPAAAGASLAQYNETTGAVEWNMGSTFMPEAGVTYQVRFKVWPSQEAYDYIAKLNNGTINYDTLPADVKAQIIKNGNTYTLKTNEPNAKTTYQSATKTGDTVKVSGETKTLMFPTVDDLNLSVDKMKVKKEWVNHLDPDDRWKSPVKLLLTDGSGTLYKEIDLNEDNGYSAEDNFISCGLAKIENGELVIYEQGHDFKLTEPADYAYYWNLDSQIYRPMIINAQLTMLVKTDAPSGMGDHTYYEYQGVKYYKIGDGRYKAISTGDSAATITATNVRRSNLNLTKKVVDENGNQALSSELFTFIVNDKIDFT